MMPEEEWKKYVAPFIKEPGCIDRDPVVAALHLTNLKWMRAMGQGHWSRTDAEWHVGRFEADIREEERERCARVAEGSIGGTPDEIARRIRTRVPQEGRPK